MFISFIEKILSSIFQKSVGSTFGRRPDGVRTPLGRLWVNTWRRPDGVRTPSGRLQTFKKFLLRFNTLETIFTKIRLNTILNHNILVFSTQNYLWYHLFPSQENWEKFSQISKMSGRLHLFWNFICVLNVKKKIFQILFLMRC